MDRIYPICGIKSKFEDLGKPELEAGDLELSLTRISWWRNAFNLQAARKMEEDNVRKHRVA